jgi:gamma-glutamylcyclotransferase (GGCT)/AIG2-like uncharacterized protein YtfP
MADKAKPTLRLVADKDLDRGCRNVFVYGTLKRSMSNHQPYLGDCRYIGESTAFGVLIHLGGFPALAEDSSGKCLVRGEVFELASPEHLVQLDRLEGVPHLYSRRTSFRTRQRSRTRLSASPRVYGSAAGSTRQATRRSSRTSKDSSRYRSQLNKKPLPRNSNRRLGG